MRYKDKCVSPRSRLASPGRHMRQVQMSINPATKQRPINRADRRAHHAPARFNGHRYVAGGLHPPALLHEDTYPHVNPPDDTCT